MSALKTSVAIVVTVIVAWGIISTILNIQSYITVYLIIASGLFLALVSFLSNIKHHSKVSIGAISRGEVYGLAVALAGYVFQINMSLTGRIDQIMMLLIQRGG